LVWGIERTTHAETHNHFALISVWIVQVVVFGVVKEGYLGTLILLCALGEC
jgi:hypothetical protein